MSESENVFRVFIGYDERQAVSYTALQQSILETASQPVSVTPADFKYASDHASWPDAVYVFTFFGALAL